MDYSQYVYYDETSPSCLRWKIDIMVGRDYRICKRKAGDVAGSLNGNGYYLTQINQNNSTGVAGVFFKVNPAGNTYAVANWTAESKVCNKYFSVDKLGVMVAFREAVLHRQKVISEMNKNGAGYSPRHGT